jgi:hypothetical protein
MPSPHAMRRSLALIGALGALVLAAPARAAFFAGEALDGPSADIQALGGVDVARDGTGGLVYVKRDGGVDHIFVSRLAGGAWQTPERVDQGLSAASSQPVIAASDGGRLAIVFVSGGEVFGVVRPAGADAFATPTLISAAGSDPAVDMSINGVAYATFTAPGTSAADVRAARLERDATSWTVLAAPIDIDPTRDAGQGLGRSRVAVSADGTAVVTWGEAGHVYARRLYGMSISTAPQDLTLDSFDGHPGGVADSPDLDIEDDSSFAWVVFRQAFDDRTRVFARRLVGSVFDPPVEIDGGESSSSPRVDMNGRGEGLAAVAGDTSSGVFADILHFDVFGPPARIDAGPPGVNPAPAPAFAENGDGVVAWAQTDGTAHARQYEVAVDAKTLPAPDPDTVISTPDLGGVDPTVGFDAASDRAGDVAIAFVQGDASGRRIVTASFDRLPGTFTGYTTQRFRRFARPPLSWAPSFELWGPITYTVQIDGQPVGQTTDTKLTPLNAVPDGIHRWRVVAADRRGQTTASPTRLLRVDATPPRVSFRVSGVRKRGRLVKFRVKAGDVLTPTASGIALVRIDFGDRSGVVLGRKAVHVYRRTGRFTVRVSATDRAGNVTVVRRKVRIKA